MPVAINTPLQVITRDNATQIEELAALGQDYTEPVRIVAFSPDSKLVVCSTYNKIYLWDAHWRQLRFEREISAQCLDISPDGETLVVGGQAVAFLSLPDGEQQAVLKGHVGGTTAVAFSPDGTMLASGGIDGLVRVGRLDSRRLVCQLEHPAPVRALAFSPDGETIATISWGSDEQPRQTRLWRVSTGELIDTIACNKEKSISFSPDGKLLAIEGRIYDIENGTTRYNFQERQVAFSPDGELAVSCHHNFPTVGVWDMSTGEKILSRSGHEDPVWQVAFSPDGLRLVSCSGSLRMSAALRGEDDETGDSSLRLWGVPGEKKETPARQRRPLKRLGGDDEEPEEDESKSNPVQDLFNRFSR